MSLSFISKKKLTLLRKLGRKKNRQKEQLFLVEGARAVQQLIENKQIAVEGLFFDENQQYWQQPFWSNILDLYSTALVSSKDFATIADTD
ncbi:MAG TPA: hypothetical protein VK074_05290, partial [Fodinibius sp.]|nr:hypothetical protein [Fodinibius sp.]